MKRNLFLFLSVSLMVIIFSTISYAETDEFTLSIGEYEADLGSEISIPLTISNNPGICGMTVCITYDEKLTLSNIVAGDNFKSLIMTKPGNLTEKSIKILWDGISNNTNNGVLAELSFDTPVIPGTYAVTLSYDQGDIVDEGFNEIEPLVMQGNIVVNGASIPDTESFVIGAGITHIEDEAFAGCVGIKAIYFKGDLPLIGTNAFSGLSENVIIYYPKDNETWTEEAIQNIGINNEFRPYYVNN